MEHLDVDTVLGIAKCESGFNAGAVGDHGTSFGIFQIHLPAHLEVSQEEALSATWNIHWAIDEMVKNGYGIWSCYSMLKSNLLANG